MHIDLLHRLLTVSGMQLSVLQCDHMSAGAVRELRHRTLLQHCYLSGQTPIVYNLCVRTKCGSHYNAYKLFIYFMLILHINLNNVMQLTPISTVCRPAAGSCDLAEYCSGVNNTCPSDAYVRNGTTCTVGGVSNL
jgi:hypothetical protein